jgi:predicted ArsR family transcriptional regulator
MFLEFLQKAGGRSNELQEGTRGRVIEILRRGRATVDEIAAELGLTGNAVRAQLMGLQRDGLVRSAGSVPGATRPPQTYELTPELEQLLSRAYIPLVTHLLRLFAANEPAEKFDWAMREVGRGLAREVATTLPDGSLAARVDAVSVILNRELGASTTVQEVSDGYVIRGHGCPLAALTGKHPEVCHAIESLASELIQAKVKECCDRTERPRCCFEVRARPVGRKKKLA